MGTKSVRRARRRRIFLVDDHPIVREGLAAVLNSQPDFQVCGACGPGKHALQSISRSTPELVIIEIALGGADGLELVKRIRDHNQTLGILVLSNHDERLYASRALKAGAKGYIMKHAPVAEVLSAIRSILAGRVYVSRPMQKGVVHRSITRSASAKLSIDQLTDREVEVFALLGRGATTTQIAKKLNVDPKTVQTHHAHVRQKLKLRNAADLQRAAFEFEQNGHNCRLP